MLAFEAMSRTWIWIFALVIVALFLVAAVVKAAPNLKQHVNLVALALAVLAVWAVFTFYEILASQRGALGLAWAEKLRAGIVAFVASLKKPATIKKFLTYVVAALGALVANGVLTGSELVVANVVIAVLGGAGIWSFANAPV